MTRGQGREAPSPLPVASKYRRGLDAAALDSLALDDIRGLVQVLAVEHGHVIHSAVQRGRDVDLVVEASIVGRSEHSVSNDPPTSANARQ